jgi:NAD-reducing hydrogenase large subunit
MTDGSLETADRTGLRRVAIDPVTRVEGHGKVTILVDEANRVHQVRLHIVEFRGFERFVEGRPYTELPVLVQRLCGICPVSHHVAAGKAVDILSGAAPLPPETEAIRRLMHIGQILQSHATHFFHLASPDLLFGMDSPTEQRDFFHVMGRRQEVAKDGIALRRFGQEVIAAVSGKRIHGTCAIPGGVNRGMTAADRQRLSAAIPEMLERAERGIEVFRSCYAADLERNRAFGTVPGNMLSLVQGDGTLELYDGVLRARAPDGAMLFDGLPAAAYRQRITEAVKPWTYMKFPFFHDLGQEQGWYRVGPLARIVNCERLGTPRAEIQRQAFLEQEGRWVQSLLATHWARLIEVLHAAELIAGLLAEEAIEQPRQAEMGPVRHEAVSIVEAPRGTLIHQYGMDNRGLIRSANLIVSTTNNNQAMNEAIRRVARDELDGHVLTEPLLNHVETAIRAYDPCLSCATHALGQMPLVIELQDGSGRTLDTIQRDPDGLIVHA